jgi:hypothetical protein
VLVGIRNVGVLLARLVTSILPVIVQQCLHGRGSAKLVDLE